MSTQIEGIANIDRVFNEQIIGRLPLFISDFDMTLATRYVYSSRWQTHVPIIDGELIDCLRTSNHRMCIATARGGLEPVSWMITNSLLRDSSIPLVVENGAALIWKTPSIRSQPHVEILISNEDQRTIKHIQNHLPEVMSNTKLASTENTVLIRNNRLASIEIRAEHAISHIGTPEDYQSISESICKAFAGVGLSISLSTTGSSLTIQSSGIDKQSGIRAALDLAGIDPSHFLLIGLGDNLNDTPLFQFVHSFDGITIGLSTEADSAHCDVVFKKESVPAHHIINHIQTKII